MSIHDPQIFGSLILACLPEKAQAIVAERATTDPEYTALLAKVAYNLAGMKRNPRIFRFDLGLFDEEMEEEFGHYLNNASGEKDDVLEIDADEQEILAHGGRYDDNGREIQGYRRDTSHDHDQGKFNESI